MSTILFLGPAEIHFGDLIQLCSDNNLIVDVAYCPFNIDFDKYEFMLVEYSFFGSYLFLALMTNFSEKAKYWRDENFGFYLLVKDDAINTQGYQRIRWTLEKALNKHYIRAYNSFGCYCTIRTKNKDQ